MKKVGWGEMGEGGGLSLVKDSPRFLCRVFYIENNITWIFPRNRGRGRGQGG